MLKRVELTDSAIAEKIALSQLHMLLSISHTVTTVLQLCLLISSETEMASFVMFCAFFPLCFPLVTYRETSMGVKLNFAYQM